MNPSDFLDEVETRLREDKSYIRGNTARKILESLVERPPMPDCRGPTIDDPGPKRPAPRPVRKRVSGDEQGKRAASMIHELDGMSDEMFVLLYMELSREFQRRFDAPGWTDRVADVTLTDCPMEESLAQCNGLSDSEVEKLLAGAIF